MRGICTWAWECIFCFPFYYYTSVLFLSNGKCKKRMQEIEIWFGKKVLFPCIYLWPSIVFFPLPLFSHGMKKCCSGYPLRHSLYIWKKYSGPAQDFFG